MSVRPSSSTSIGPLTVSTVATSYSLRSRAEGTYPVLRVARILGSSVAASVDGRAEQNTERGDDERDDQPDDHRRVRPVLKEREQAEDEREGERKPTPLADRGIAEADAGDEEQEVRDDAAHGRLIPRRGEDESWVVRRGSQDSNLESPVLENGALANSA